MRKILACLLSFVIVFTSVTPSLAGINTRKTKKVTVARERRIPAERETPKRETVTPTQTSRQTSQTSTAGGERISSPTHSSITHPTTSSLSRKGSIDATQMQRAILSKARASLHTTYGTLLPGRASNLKHANHLILLSEFPIWVLTERVSPAELAKGLEFYRTNLEKVTFDGFPKSLASSPEIVEELVETAANISSLGLIGEAAQDVPLLFKLYQESVGTVAEPIITTVTSHALLRLEAWKELQEMSEISEIHPELWDGISSYAKANNLELNIAQKQRASVDMREFAPSIEKYGNLTSLAASVDEFSTFLYANAAKEIEKGESSLSSSAETASQIPEGFSLELDPAVGGRPSQLYASAGAPVANTAKVQPLMQAPIEQPVVAEPVVAAAQAGATTVTTPKYISWQTTNALGEKVQSWQLNPKYVDPNPTPTITLKKNLSWKDRLRLEFSTAMFNAQLFVKSRYGWMTLTPAAAPLTAEAAVHVAPTMEVVEQVRAAEQGFITTEEFVAGPGASHRTGSVNPGGMVSQKATERTARLAENQKIAPQTTTSVTGLTISTSLAGTRTITMSGSSSTSGIAASSLLPIRRSWLNKLTGSTSARDLRKQADKHAQNIFNQGAPLATSLVSILQSNASVQYKQTALVHLYKMGKLQDILQQTLTPAALQAVVELGHTYDTEKLGERLYTLYVTQIISEGVNNITDTPELGALRQELTDIVSTPGFTSQSAALAELTKQMPILSAEDIGINTYIAPDADLKRIYATFRTEEGFVDNFVVPEDRGDVVHYDKRIPFYYRDSHGQLSEKPVGVLTQIQSSKYGNILSRIPFWFKLPSLRSPSTWFSRSSWGLKYMADRPGIDIPKGFVLALDENGQWKLVKQNRELAESNPISQKLLHEIEEKGSVQVGLATPYSTTDMLAIAKMLERKTQAQKADKMSTPLSFELELNSADSLKQMLKVWGLYIGLDTGASLAGPYKEALKGLSGSPVNAVANAMAGLGYLSPAVAAASSAKLRGWGLTKSMYGLFGVAAIGLGYSLFGLGMTGFDNPEALGLLKPAIPLATAIFTGSLFGLLQPVLLSTIYKNPVARHEANLEFASTKQFSRMILTAATFAFGLEQLGGLAWTLAIPVAFSLLGVTFMLFMNTPLVRSSAGIPVTDPTAQSLLSTVKEATKDERSAEEKKEERKEFAKTYKEMITKSPTVKGIRDRVINVYAGYAPLLAIVSQVVNAGGVLPLVGGQKIGQLVMVGFMACSYIMREWAKKAVKTGKYTDDQLTGLSLPILAAASTAIMVMPYSSTWALATALVVAALYVGTAVPGQLDNTRMQNIVSERISSLKKEVHSDESLTPKQREEQLEKLKRQESDWSFRASRDYSYYNAGGLFGVAAATAIAYMLSDQHVADGLLQALQMYGENPVFTMDRLVFAVSSVLLGGLAWRHRNLTIDFWNALKPVKITEDNIQAGNVNASAFGISASNADVNLGKLNKSISDLQKLSIEYGLTSERKMTDMLNTMIQTYNRLLAIKEVKGMSVGLKGSFNDLLALARNYQKALQYNDMSVMLNREFDKFRMALSRDGQLNELSENMTYLEEGTYKLPAEYVKYEEAKDLIQKDLFQLAHHILNGVEVNANTYQLFMEYHNRAKTDLLQYTEQNVADSRRASALLQELDNLCLVLKYADTENGVLETHAGPTSLRNIQALRDMLAGFPDR